MEDLQNIARRWLALWNGDTALLEELVSGTVITHAVLIGQTAEKPMVGREALGSWIAQTHAAMPGLRFTPEVGPLVDGDMIALRWRAQGDGRSKLNFTGTDMLRVEDAQVVEYWVNTDTSLMLAQVHDAPPPS